jgi:elongator complex protein 2
LQTIKPSPKFFPLDLALASPSQESNIFILAAAGTRDTIQIFAATCTDGGTPEFKHQATLSGHEGWIRSLDFTLEKDGAGSDLLLASASQDKYIRVWRVHQGKQLPALSAAAASADPSSSAYLPGKSPSNKAHRLNVCDKDFSITFEALLLGHEDWIYSVKWSRLSAGKLSLLSTSADNSLAMWEPDPSSGIWVSTVRLGDISREKGATTATGSIGGFWTGLWRADGKSVVCLGRTGSWRRWDYDESDDQWKPAIAVTGHAKSVTGLSWSKNGGYLLSTSSDQTTRLHAPWIRNGTATWHEMSRPQIHGYDLNCVDALGNNSQFVSGADEKLMRVFNEPKPVAKLLRKLGGANADLENLEQLPDAANIPALGLSNKAVDQEAAPEQLPNGRETEQPVDAAISSTALKSALDIARPPFEDTLSRYTLWPETEKLYGHGYEISCLAASHDGTLIASACKASSANHAVIRLFETSRWTEIKPPLTAHSLTATRLRFSPDDRFLLSVGRDRQWAVFERHADAGGTISYKPLQPNPKGHSRMILDAAWAPLTGDGKKRGFATAGRDKQVKIWAGGEEEDAKEGKIDAFLLVTTIPGELPVTAVDFLPVKNKEGHFVLAVGNEGGKIFLYSLDSRDLTIVSTAKLKDE